MKKTIKLSKELSGVKYLYRISSISLDKVSLEKHAVVINNNMEKEFITELNDNTKVGIVVQKMNSFIISDISKKVDHIAVDFIMGEKDKQINKIVFEGVTVV